MKTFHQRLASDYFKIGLAVALFLIGMILYLIHPVLTLACFAGGWWVMKSNSPRLNDGRGVVVSHILNFFVDQVPPSPGAIPVGPEWEASHTPTQWACESGEVAIGDLRIGFFDKRGIAVIGYITEGKTVLGDVANSQVRPPSWVLETWDISRPGFQARCFSFPVSTDDVADTVRQAHFRLTNSALDVALASPLSLGALVQLRSVIFFGDSPLNPQTVRRPSSCTPTGAPETDGHYMNWGDYRIAFIDLSSSHFGTTGEPYTLVTRCKWPADGVIIRAVSAGERFRPGEESSLATHVEGAKDEETMVALLSGESARFRQSWAVIGSVSGDIEAKLADALALLPDTVMPIRYGITRALLAVVPAP